MTFKGSCGQDDFKGFVWAGRSFLVAENSLGLRKLNDFDIAKTFKCYNLKISNNFKWFVQR